MTAAARTESPSAIDEAWFIRYWHLILLVVGVVVLQAAFFWVDEFPALLDDTFSDPLDSFGRWQQANRRTHILYTGFFTPLSDIVGWALDTVESALLWAPWFVIPVAVFLVVARSRGWRLALVPALAMTYPGLVGLWEVTIDTLALMTIAVFLCVLIGVPLGIWGAQRPRAEKMMRPRWTPCRPFRRPSTSFPC